MRSFDDETGPGHSGGDHPLHFDSTFRNSHAEPASPPDHPALLEEITFLDIRGSDGNYRLEALIVRPAAAKGRLPIALITHGKQRLPTDMAKIRAELMSPEARDLAYRGYLAVAVVRRGFGVSGGTPGRATNAPYAKCNDADLRRYFAVEADDWSARCASSPNARRRRHPDHRTRWFGGRWCGARARRTQSTGTESGGEPRRRRADHQRRRRSHLSAGPANRRARVIRQPDQDADAVDLLGERQQLRTDDARKVHAGYVAKGGVGTLKIAPSLAPNDGHHVFELPAGRSTGSPHSIPSCAHKAADVE